MHLYYFTENKNLGGGYIPLGDTSPIPPCSTMGERSEPNVIHWEIHPPYPCSTCESTVEYIFSLKNNSKTIIHNKYIKV